MKILVAIGNEAERKRIKMFLRSKGHVVLASTDGMAALVKTRAQRKSLNLVIADNKMPCLSGTELVAEMRQRGILVPVIGMSDNEECRLLYENFWWKKEPVEILLALIAKLTEKSS